MKSYIKIENNKPTGSIYGQDYMEKLFPEHNFSSGPPANYAEIILTPRPPVPRFHKIIVKDYTWAGGKLYDTIEVVPMTLAEKETEVERAKLNFYRNTGYNSWTYNTQLNVFEPPFQPTNPVQGGRYEWNEQNQNWTLIGVEEPPSAT
jgi:hypothetical protein